MPKIAEDKAACRAKCDQVRRAARQLFMAGGYRYTTMDQIANLADVSKTTLYAYFPNKEALFLAIIEDEKRRFGLNIPEELGPGPIDVRAILTAIAKAMTELMTDQSLVAVFRTVLAESGQTPALGRTIWEAGPKKFMSRIAQLLERMAEAGYLTLDDPATAASRFLALVRGELHLHTLMDSQFVPEPADLVRHVDQAVDFFLRHYERRKE